MDTAFHCQIRNNSVFQEKVGNYRSRQAHERQWRIRLAVSTDLHSNLFFDSFGGRCFKFRHLQSEISGWMLCRSSSVWLCSTAPSKYSNSLRASPGALKLYESVDRTWSADCSYCRRNTSVGRVCFTSLLVFFYPLLQRDTLLLCVFRQRHAHRLTSVRFITSLMGASGC